MTKHWAESLRITYNSLGSRQVRLYTWPAGTVCGLWNNSFVVWSTRQQLCVTLWWRKLLIFQQTVRVIKQQTRKWRLRQTRIKRSIKNDWRHSTNYWLFYTVNDSGNQQSWLSVYLSIITSHAQIVKSSTSAVMSRSHCSSGDIINDTITPRDAAAEIRSVEMISGKLCL